MAAALMQFAFGFALMAAYWPGIAGAATTPRWDVAALLPLALFFAPRVRMTAAHWCGLALLGWLLLSLIWSQGRLDGFDEAFKLSLGAIGFVVGSTLTDLRRLTLGAAIGLIPSSLIAIAQAAGWHLLPQYGAAGGLFYNADRLAAAAAIVIMAAVALRMWIVVPGLVPALVLPQCRGALIAVAAGFAVTALRKRSMRWRLLLLGAAALAVFVIIYRGFDPGVTQRFELWRDTANALNWSGHGLGAFWSTFPQIASDFIAKWGTRPDAPHNEWLWLAYEGGAVGLILGLACAIAIAVRPVAPMHAVLAGLFVLSFLSVAPFHDPATLIFGALCAGHLCGDGDPICDVAVERGLSLRAWLAAWGNERRHAAA